MRRVGIAGALLAASAAVAPAAFAQTTPGQINDPGSYRGSMANQAQEQQAYRQQEARQPADAAAPGSDLRAVRPQTAAGERHRASA
jgi:hypothetical protein